MRAYARAGEEDEELWPEAATGAPSPHDDGPRGTSSTVVPGRSGSGWTFGGRSVVARSRSRGAGSRIA